MKNDKKNEKARQIWLSRQIIGQKTHIFKDKFKEQTSTAIITAFGLVVALAWKDVIVEFINKINPKPSNLLISAIIVTIIAVAGISLIHLWEKPREKSKKR